MSAIATPNPKVAANYTDDRAEIAVDELNADHGLPRFFFAAGISLVISAVHGIVQRLPMFAEWIRTADYGGHMITNLAQTHITIVGAGTITLTALLYYILPRLGRRPLYSNTLTSVSFWFTVVGVFGFYLAVLSVGAYEGMMVHAGWKYEDARDFLGAWHKVPIAATAAVMGIGYWTFTANVLLTARSINRFRKENPKEGASPIEWLLVQFCVVSSLALFVGTVQGVYQVMPWSLDWLHKAGEAGQMIDPMAHAHMNLVGGVSIGMMALLYFFLPRMLGRPIYSYKLARFSYFTVVIGVFSFWLVAIILGFVEGTPIVEGRMTYDQIRAQVGLWHTIPLVTAAMIMGVGFWAFIANIFLTLKKGAAPDAPADHWLSRFVGISTACLLVGTVQGVLQSTPLVHDWLDTAQGTGWMVTPYAHAQLNLVGFAILGLVTLATFALPRVTGRPLLSVPFAKRTLAVIASGIIATYLVFLVMGLIETVAMYQKFPGGTQGTMDDFLPPDAAVIVRSAVGGDFVHTALVLLVACWVGLGYFMLMRHLAGSIGSETIRAYRRTFFGRMKTAARQHAVPHPSAVPDDPRQLTRRALQLAVTEAGAGWAGFMGMGWLMSGRGFIGIMILSLWAGVYWSSLFILFAVTQAGPLAIGIMVFTWLLLPFLSAVAVYRTYMGGARAILAEREASR
ncbi:MAG: cbb3-type cytochrome c oxidase subunit I [Chloroflexia bacterium]